ncbi:hypothetical protein HK099_005638 [Clydaea vesicula]|uniref:Uncharacterized protein n=1 Tax=Clydaea vesicula TaxID=447962 RepID=A0AAD5U697_9FUNG|nr:hypothetical protein HK099_005638 [Clydaea vesicula]KAJ3390950.1 hypothetical protein HDU92_000202 [Lobulomyces angularis]
MHYIPTFDTLSYYIDSLRSYLNSVFQRRKGIECHKNKIPQLNETMHYNDFYESLHEITKNKVLHPFYIGSEKQKLLEVLPNDIQVERKDSAYIEENPKKMDEFVNANYDFEYFNLSEKKKKMRPKSIC